MSGQRRWLKVWARTVGMPIGMDDDEKPTDLPITMRDVSRPGIPHLLDCPAHRDLCRHYCRQRSYARLLVNSLPFIRHSGDSLRSVGSRHSVKERHDFFTRPRLG